MQNDKIQSNLKTLLHTQNEILNNLGEFEIIQKQNIILYNEDLNPEFIGLSSRKMEKYFINHNP